MYMRYRARLENGWLINLPTYYYSKCRKPIRNMKNGTINQKEMIQNVHSGFLLQKFQWWTINFKIKAPRIQDLDVDRVFIYIRDIGIGQ